MAKDIKKKIVEELTQDLVNSGKPQEVQADFIDIKGRAGWRRIQEVLDIKIKGYEQSILDSEIQGEDLSRERDRRDLCLWFRNLPDILIQSIDTSVDIPEPNLDPFSESFQKKIELVDKDI
jgi:hypothetical protein